MLTQMLLHPLQKQCSENRKFIASETLAWINDPIANAGGSGMERIHTTQQNVKETLKIVAPMVHDIGHGGNLETRRHAASYWFNAPTQVFIYNKQLWH